MNNQQKLFVYIFINLVAFGNPTAQEGIHNNYLPPPGILQAYSKAVAIEDYQSAYKIADEFSNNSTSCAWSSEWVELMRCGLLVFQMVDYGDTLGLAHYLQQYENSSQAFTSKLKSALSAQDSAAACFALGTLMGFESSRLENDGSRLSALSPAKSSNRYLNEALDIDESLLDAELGVALYDYWTSKFLGFLHWTPLSRDKRPESILRIRKVMKKGNYSRYLAGAYLSWILIEEEDYAEATAVADSFLALLGESRAFLEPCGKAFFMAENWVEAEDRYSRLISSIQDAPRRNEVREIGAWHRLAAIAHETENWNRLIEISDEVEKIELSQEQLNRKAKDLKNIAQFSNNAKRQLEQSNP